MDRKVFLTTTVGGVAAVAATSVAAAAPAPGQAQIDALSNHNLQFMMTIISAIVNDLRADAYDYGGHKKAAAASLQTANTELQQAINYVQSRGQ
jgi:hypothetical protein